MHQLLLGVVQGADEEQFFVFRPAGEKSELSLAGTCSLKRCFSANLLGLFAEYLMSFH